MQADRLKAGAFITFVAFVGSSVFAYGMLNWHSQDLVKLAVYLVIAAIASGLKVSLPGVNGTMSVNFLFVLLGIVELDLPEALLIGLAGVLTQILWKSRKVTPVHLAFNLGGNAAAIGASYFAYQYVENRWFAHSLALSLVAAASVYFLANTVPIAGVISLTEHKSVRKVWKECYFWCFPYYLFGAALTGLAHVINQRAGWETSLLAFPAVYWIYRSYRLYLERLENEKKHVEDMASLHLRTIEALALAIEAKDHTTHEHLKRVRVYAVEIAKEMKVSQEELEALRAASLLHDIGKLAVPEHIISKPGKLTPEEFEKMKIHPIVGAEILQRVEFPYPVVPIVRAHHEKWDGSGYPFGLRGEEIPVGARILAAVDCLDALASHRQYRRALPLDEAMRHVEMEAGASFDPHVVAVLKKHFRELERKAQDQDHPLVKLSTDVKVEKGTPDAGLEHNEADRDEQAVIAKAHQVEFLSSIASARQEAQMLFELSQTIGNSLSLDETLSVLSVRLKRLIPYDSIAIYCKKDDRLVPEFVTGDNFRLFSSLQIPMGQGLSGWVAQNRKAIVNGNPSVEPGYLADESKFSTLRSALAVPLEGLQGVLGVLALYHSEKDAFTNDHLRILLAIASKLGLSIENALKYRLAETSATTDYLTGLPNARSLFLHLDREMARCRRHDEALTVLVCDLDGFKQVNDRFGHLEGNRLLRAFAQKLKESCREYDYVARMGGDEFVVVAPGLTAESSLEKSFSFNQLAMEAGRQITGEDIISLSVGAAFYPRDGRDAEQLLAEADRRMYVVKQQHHAGIDISQEVPRAAKVN
ncbi:MAG TPA: HD domain-containing phosphohydrolase [Terriglobales bacterium]|nr:HD domain-containing phosphohydrolase [Terriglobales bacterium]